MEGWHALSSLQPKTVDRKTTEPGPRAVLQVRAQPRRPVTNQQGEPSSPRCCRPRTGGFPDTECRGKITSHRARSTIRQPAYNAKGTMTFIRAAGLGSAPPTPTTTQHYAEKNNPEHGSKRRYNRTPATSPATCAIEVLVDRGRRHHPRRPPPPDSRRQALRTSGPTDTAATASSEAVPPRDGLRPCDFLHPGRNTTRSQLPGKPRRTCSGCSSVYPAPPTDEPRRRREGQTAPSRASPRPPQPTRPTPRAGPTPAANRHPTHRQPALPIIRLTHS